MGTSVKTGLMPGEPVLKFRSPKSSILKNFKNPLKKPVCAFENCGLEWQWSGNHSENFAKAEKSFNPDAENFRLAVLQRGSKNQNGFPVLWNSSNVLTQKIQYENFYLKTVLDVSSLPNGSRSGMIFLADEYASVAIEKTVAGFDFVYLKSKNEDLTDDTRSEFEVYREHLKLKNENQPIKIRMDFISFSTYSGAVQFTVKTGRGLKNSFKWKSDFFTTESAHWVGGRFGIYAIGNANADENGSALFKSIKVRH